MFADPFYNYLTISMSRFCHNTSYAPLYYACFRSGKVECGAAISLIQAVVETL